jgi:capsular exopolysaccharide synthesis family protein
MDKGLPRAGSGFREAHLRDYWKIVWQGRWTILAVFVVTLGGTGVWTYLQTPIYRATAIVEVQPQARQIMSGGDVSGLGAAGYGWFAEEKYHNTQVEIIKSRDIGRRVVKTLGLDLHPMFEDHPEPADLFRGMIQVDPRRDTGLLEISMTGQDPDEITQWANAAANAYVQRNFDKAKDNMDLAMGAIEEQLSALKRDLSDAEDERIGALQDEDSQILNAAKQENIVADRLQTFNTELTEVRIELSSLDSKLRQIRDMRRRGHDLMTLAEFSSDTALQELFRSKNELDRELESAKVDLGPSHPEFEKKQAALATVQAEIDDKIRGKVTGLESQYSVALAKQDYLEKQVRAAEEFSVEVAKATSRYDFIKTDAESKKQIFDLIAMTMREINLNNKLMSNNIAVLDEAVPPLYPIKPRKRVNLMIGAMFGMFLGLGVVFFLDYLDNTIRTPEDVEKYLGLTAIGVVPKMQPGDGEALEQRAVKEAYQSLRTSIIFSSKNRQRKIALITSSGPREGKSSTVANLGRTLAAAGDRVCIIDCDLRRPKQHEHHGLQREPGLTNYLAAPAEELDWSPYVKNSKPVNLHLLTCGPLPPSPPDLLGNERFRNMLEMMREVYDWVLIDSPPAASLADSSLLASLADMLVLVVQHNQTDRDHVIKTVQTLGAVNENFAGVVLNNVDMDRTYHKDYYYAGYYYEEDGSKEKRFRRKGVEHKAQVG